MVAEKHYNVQRQFIKFNVLNGCPVNRWTVLFILLFRACEKKSVQVRACALAFVNGFSRISVINMNHFV